MEATDAPNSVMLSRERQHVLILRGKPQHVLLDGPAICQQHTNSLIEWIPSRLAVPESDRFLPVTVPFILQLIDPALNHLHLLT